MEAIVAIIVQLVGGGVGGNGIAAIVKKVNLGTVGNTVTGAIGGWLGTWIASMIPGLSGLVTGAATTVADTTAAAGDAAVAATTSGGLDIGMLAGQGLTGLVGGGILTAVAGLIKNTMMKSA